MFKSYRNTIAKVLLLCMLAQPCLMLATAAETQQTQPAPIVEQPISSTLKSPLKKELAILSQFSAVPLLNNDKIVLGLFNMPTSLNDKLLTILRNKMVLTWPEIAAGTHFNAQEFTQKQTRIKLFNDLQFANRDGQNSITQMLGKIVTKAGQASFMNLIATPVDAETTMQRQAFIKELVRNPELLENLRSELNKIKLHEEELAKQVPLNPTLMDIIPLQSKLMVAASLELSIGFSIAGYLQNAGMMSKTEFAKNELYVHAAFAAVYALYQLCKVEEIGNLGEILTQTILATLTVGGAVAIPAVLFNEKCGNYKVSQLWGQPAIGGLAKAQLTLMGAYALYYAHMYLSKKRADNVTNYNDAKGIAQITRAINSLKKTLLGSKNSVLVDAFSPLFADQTTPEWKELVAKTETSTFDDSNEYGLFNVNHPRFNNVLGLLKGSIGDFSKMLQFYGEVDAYAAMAQLLIDTKNTTNQFGEPTTCCFVDLLQDSEESVVRAQGMWHPIIPQVVVRTNSITLGGSKETPRNAIITGPNAAGKSVSLKALLVNIVLGQTFGIACAESFAFTPYTKIIARFTSADNTASGQSKFMLEAGDVVSMLKELESLQPGEKAIVITDELFSGTEVKPAILLSSQLCKEVSTMKNVNYLLATHYKDLAQLKELTNGAFENYKVTAFVDENSNVSYPFKLEHGVGNVNVAFDIFLDQMRKQGLSNERLEAIIKNAREQHIATQQA